MTHCVAWAVSLPPAQGPPLIGGRGAHTPSTRSVFLSAWHRVSKSPSDMEFQEGLPGLIFNSQQRVHSWATQASSPQLGTRPGKAPDGDWQCWLSVLSTLHPALGPLFWTSAPLLQNGGGGGCSMSFLLATTMERTPISVCSCVTLVKWLALPEPQFDAM